MTTTSAQQHSTPLIEFKNVSKYYGKGQSSVQALNDINFSIYQGEFIAIMGPSGSGKSTAMNILGCLDTPSLGSYFFKGINTGELVADQRTLLRRNYLGFIFQNFNLLSRTSALENIELPLTYRGISSKERRKHALKALEHVGLLKRGKHNNNELSGGEQQRVAIARAIVSNPSVIVADEPTGNLDSKTSDEIMTLLKDLTYNYGITIIMVTHEEDIAINAKRIIRFHDGRIITDEPIKGRA